MKRLHKMFALLLSLCLLTTSAFAGQMPVDNNHEHTERCEVTHDYSGRELTDAERILTDILEAHGSGITTDALAQDLSSIYPNSVVVHISEITNSEELSNYLSINGNKEFAYVGYEGADPEDVTSMFNTLSQSDIDGYLIMWVDGDVVNVAIAIACPYCSAALLAILKDVVNWFLSGGILWKVVLFEVVCLACHYIGEHTENEYVRPTPKCGCGREFTWQGYDNWYCTNCQVWLAP